MSNSDILSLTFELREKIVNSEIYKELKKSEKEMLEDKECSLLLSEFEKAKEEYNQAKRFEKYGSNVESASKRLSEIKYIVDQNKFVKEYNKAYKEMKKQLKEIEKIILKDIVKEKKEITIEE